ncbi:MAG: coproporphyrinogen III oxidase, partial [bacterium]
EFNIPRESVESLAMNDKLEEFASEGLIEFNRDKLEVKEKGKFFIRNIAATFDPAYKPENNKYSRSV